jgi:hypothetical protein
VGRTCSIVPVCKDARQAKAVPDNRRRLLCATTVQCVVHVYWGACLLGKTEMSLSDSSCPSRSESCMATSHLLHMSEIHAFTFIGGWAGIPSSLYTCAVQGYGCCFPDACSQPKASCQLIPNSDDICHKQGSYLWSQGLSALLMIASAHTSTAIGGHFTECQAFVYVQAENAAAKLCDRHDRTSSAPNRKRLCSPKMQLCMEFLALT